MKPSLLFVLATLAVLPAVHAQTAAPAAPPARATERPEAGVVAKLKSGPPLPYKVDPNWAKLPPGYNFGECSGVDLDRDGNVWVFNRGRWPLIQLDRSGKMTKAISTDTIRFASTHGLRVGPDGNLWCIDVEGHVLFKLNPDGRVLMVLGNRQTVAGNNEAKDGFNRPTNIAFRANGNLYISDGYLNSRVAQYSADGDYLGQWGRPGKGDGEFNLVHDVAVDSQGRVYVADRTNERIQIFDADGKFLAKWENIGAPWGIAYSAQDNAIFMCDGKYARIIKLDLEGKVLGVLGSYGRAPGKLDYAHSIAVDPRDGSLYTVEIKTWRVQKWVKQ